MKFSIWNPISYLDPEAAGEWPTPPRHWRPEEGVASLGHALGLYDLAVRAGFDMVTVTEHHAGANSLVPSPTVLAAALAQRYSEVTIAILGPVLPLADPVRVAEELAMVDLLSGGRVLAGFFRGVPTESIALSVNPAESAARFDEAFDLIRRAWIEPEPFGWEGRHYRYRSVAVWPRPLQQPHPPLLAGAMSPASAVRIAERGLRLGLFGPLMSRDRAVEIAAAYRATPAERTPTSPADSVLYRARVYVSDTDEQAREEGERFGGAGHAMGPRAARTQRLFDALAEATGGGTPKRSGGSAGPAGFSEFRGSPATVARQIREAGDRIGFDIADLLFALPGVPPEKVRRSLELFTSEALPELRSTIAQRPENRGPVSLS